MSLYSILLTSTNTSVRVSLLLWITLRSRLTNRLQASSGGNWTYPPTSKKLTWSTEEIVKKVQTLYYNLYRI